MTEAVLKISTDADAVQEAILPLIKEILGADCEEATKRAALEMVGRVVKVENVSIMNCNLSGDKVVNMDGEDAE
ncbi:MAG: hypothetical protein KAI73_07355 [Rhodospirillaceae bacterium]|nr:hypothetical protein [Rhodospirillaceae bacterium]